MFIPPPHAETRLPVLRQLIRDNPLGILTTATLSPDSSHPQLHASHIPFVLDEPTSSDPSDLGCLRGHLARQNPQAKALIQAAAASADGTLPQEVLVVFTSDVSHYVTPKFYTETKPTTAKVVPTWNYAAAQVYGRLTLHHDSSSSSTKEFLLRQTEDLSIISEKDIMGYGEEEAWKVSDAPERYVELLMKNIVGVEIRVERLEGKFKMSQEMRRGDRDGVVEGFEGLGSERGAEMGRLVRERGVLKDAERNS